MDPRPYQTECCNAVTAGWNRFRKLLAVLPTGAGKTIISAILARDAVRAGGRVLFLAHRHELLTQTRDKFAIAAGLDTGLEQAENRAALDAPAVVASVQTMTARGDRWPADHFSLVIVDEAHHTLAASYRNVLARFDAAACVLGITATPDRADRKNLGEYFEDVAYEITLAELVAQGYLARPLVKTIPLAIDLSAVRRTAGDLNAGDLDGALAPWLSAIAQAVRDKTDFRRTLAFLPLVATSRAFVDQCRAAGLTAQHVDGNSPDRAEILADFAAGRWDILSNSMLLTEGYDCPAVDCILPLRLTTSRALYCQMIGRGTRVHPGKTDCLILDCLWQYEKHGLIRPAHLVARSEADAEAATQRFEAAATAGGGDGAGADLFATMGDVVEARERKLAEELRAKAKRKARTVDAIEYCLGIGAHELADYEPTMKWEANPITPKQRAWLEARGMDLDRVTCAGHASKIMDALITRSKLNLATPKQVRLLRQFGHPDPERATHTEASAYISDRIGGSKKVEEKTCAGV